MTIVILGAGALGSVIGGCLAENGFDVTLVTRNKDHVSKINETGLKIVSRTGKRTIEAKATTNPRDISKARFLILLVKTKDTIDALESVAHLKQQKDLCVMSLQNGVAKNEVLSDFFGGEKVIGATTIIGATLLEPGKVAHTYDGITYFGELNNEKTERVLGITRMFNESGLETRIPESIQSAEWTKLIQYTPAASLAAVTRLFFHKILKDEHTAYLFVSVVRECAALARKLGIVIKDYFNFGIEQLVDADMDIAVEMIRNRGEQFEKNGLTKIKISMLQDIERGRKTEVDATIGYIVKKAKEYGVSVPNLEFAWRVIKAIE